MRRGFGSLAGVIVALLQLPAAASAAHVALYGVYADARGSSSVSTVNQGSGSDVWFRNGAFVGTPSAFNGGAYAAGPMTPGATGVQVATYANIATSLSQSEASGSLNRGQLKAAVALAAITPYAASGSAQASISDNIWFTNTSGGWLPIDLSLRVDGEVTGSLSRVDFFSNLTLASGGAGANSQGQSITPNADGSGGVSTSLYGEYYSQTGQTFGFREQFGGKLDQWSFSFGDDHDPDSGKFDYTSTIRLFIPEGETTLALFAWMNVSICSGNGLCDFGRTASLSFSPLPDGLSFTSQSGAFLVPVPGAAWLFCSALLALLARGRWPARC